MQAKVIVSALFGSLAAALPAQTANHTLLFTQAFDSNSLETTSRSLSKIHRLDIAAVTPGDGATMFSALPIAGLSAMIGDSDNDGVNTEYYKDTSTGNWTLSGVIVKNADKKTGDIRKAYVSVKNLGSRQQLLVFTNGGTKTHKVRSGDFVNIGPNGNAEFFITQDLIMKAAGTQSGTVARGALCMCQAPDGSLYYSPPAAGHYVSDGTKQVSVRDGGIIWIPANAITYDTKGNVQDVKAGASRLVSERGTNTPSRHMTTLTMITNSSATDKNGQLVGTTLNNWITTMTGIAIDPAGGTWTSSTLTGTTKHPHLLMVFSNAHFRGTVFSTRQDRTGLGSVAMINGQSMGLKFGKADGKWLGAKGENNSPTLHGLEVVEWGLNPKMPYGLPVLDTDNAGGIDQANQSTFALDLQGVEPLRPIYLTLGFEAPQGKPALGLEIASTFQGFPTFYTFQNGPFVGFQGVSDIRGRKFLQIPVLGDPTLKGLGLVWQAVFLARQPNAKHYVSNPVITEFR